MVNLGSDRGLADGGRKGGGEWENGGSVSAEELEMLAKLDSLLAVFMREGGNDRKGGTEKGFRV